MLYSARDFQSFRGCPIMTKLFLLPLLLLLLQARVAEPQEHCPAFWPSAHQARWTWLDRDCNIRTRADLDGILAQHKLWLQKYSNRLYGWDFLQSIGAFRDPLHADLSGAFLPLADLNGADLRFADLSGADLRFANLIGAVLEEADLSRTILVHTDLTGAKLFKADLTESTAGNADLSGANLNTADLTGAALNASYLNDAILFDAHLTNVVLNQADLTGAYLESADLTGAKLVEADLSGARLARADLSGSFLNRANLSGTDLTLAKLWYADFEPDAMPPVSSIARAEGLQTLRWSGANTFDELGYRSQLEEARKSNGTLTVRPGIPDLWLVWLSWYREKEEWDQEKPADRATSVKPAFKPLWEDVLFGLRHYQKLPAPIEQPPNQFPMIDLRNALRQAGYSEAELQVNLAYQRRTQSTLGMVLYDWTCGYGAAPGRPLVIALVVALLAVPLYWVGFRHRLFGCQLLLVEGQDEMAIEPPSGNPSGRPTIGAAHRSEPPAGKIDSGKVVGRLRVLAQGSWARLAGLSTSWWPRLRWEAHFVKLVLFFSLISMVNLGFEGLDFGRWVRNLFFREYDLKARGWLRTVSGVQSLIGLGLLALSLLSFFGDRFE
jgi:uncharacterized protein YjbI with pentapeptide repeats